MKPDWNRVCTGICDAFARVHGFVARTAGATIGWIWRTQGRLPLGLRYMSAFAAMGAVAWGVSLFIPSGFVAWAALGEDQARLLERTGELAKGAELAALARYVAYACAAAAVFAWVRIRLVFRLLEAAYAAWLLVVLLALRFLIAAPNAMVALDYKIFDKLSRNAIWTAALGALIPIVALAAVVLLSLALASVRRRYGLRDRSRKGEARVLPDGIGERVVENLRTGGADPRYRSSWYWAAFLTAFVLAAPFLFRGCGLEEPYGLVQGSGEPEVQVVKIRKIKREKKRQKFILNAWSPYILERARVDDKTLEDMLAETEDVYQADQPVKSGGRLGKGGGKSGGWPKGMENAKVRFIRLEYAGGDWDQDMGRGADYNLLLRFKAATGFAIWNETESKAISRLSRFPRHSAPPFVFLTGSRGISVSASDVEDLRRYLVDEGGMLFIDNGGGSFGGSVRSLLARVFPGQRLADIPNDDPVFRQPYAFPDGAPPFWHHDGARAKCIRVGDRIAVFYHPGDINDAWKDGHSGAAPEVAEQAYRLGINVMYYAFNAYYARHFEGASAEKKQKDM